MFSGAHEYKDMLKAEEKISTRMLSARLKKLGEDGLIASISHPENKRRKLYYLTPMGKDLIGVMVGIVLWAMTYLDEHLSIPDQKRDLLQNDPDGFIRYTLDQIETWEKENLPALK